VSSSGGVVTYDVTNLAEGHLNDGDTFFSWDPADPMNGMTLDEGAGDNSLGTVFDWGEGESRFLEHEIIPGQRDLTGSLYLSLRACEGTRHPHTVALNGPLSFTVTLRDGSGSTSSIRPTTTVSHDPTSEPGSVPAPAGRTSRDDTHPLADFAAGGSVNDLTDVVAVRLQFGQASGFAPCRLGLMT
jgi:hypothetical protein